MKNTAPAKTPKIPAKRSLTPAELTDVRGGGTHYAFVKFEANGATVTGNTDITNIGGEE